MRASFLQDLYLQRPITMIIIISMISVLPWIGLGDFSTKGEPREASVAVSMLETGNYVLPKAYANEFAYKPPMAHWMMAIFSLPQGHVSEFSARLPSALAFIVLITMVLIFFGKRLSKFHEVFIAALLLITCVEIHRAAMTTRVDMLLTTFIVAGLFQLYRWEEKLELKGLPVLIPVLLGCAALTKGLVGIVLPLFVFGVYLLMLRKYSLLSIIKALIYIGIPSLFLPMLWYIAAWKQGGDDFLNVVIGETFGRFFHFRVAAASYELGHENGVWYNFMTLFAGFIPWSVLFVFSLFGMKLHKPQKSFKEILKGWWNAILLMDKVRLFSLVSLVCIIFFYSIPSSKRSVYLMPAYPFIALFLAQYLLYLVEYRTKVTRVFATFLASVVSLVLVGLLFTMIGLINPERIVSHFTQRESTLDTVRLIVQVLTTPGLLKTTVICILVASLSILFYQLSRKINIKILYATIGLMFCINILVDGVIMRGFRNETSAQAFAEYVKKEYPLNGNNMYVMNYPKEFYNLYGLNFYLGNKFHNFEQELPSDGYFFCGSKDTEKVIKKYGDKYTFRTLTSTKQVISDVNQHIVMCHFTRK